MGHIRKSEIAKAAATAPDWYTPMVQALADATQETPTTVYLSRVAIEAIRARKEGREPRPIKPQNKQTAGRVLLNIENKWTTEGPKMWAELHAWAKAFDGDVEKATLFLFHFTARIQCKICRGHWLDMLARTPPDFSSAAAFYAWSVDRHNEVNRRLGKPEWKAESPISEQPQEATAAPSPKNAPT